MTVNVENLGALERRLTLTLAAQNVNDEVAQRLKKLARSVKVDGFRPGKVPMNIVAQQYGYSVQYEVVNDKVAEVFSKATQEANLRVAGRPVLSEKSDAPEGQMTFDATFEVYPEIQFNDLSKLQIEKVKTEVTEVAIDRTIDVLRKQRRTFAQKPATSAADDNDRVTIDFEGKIDGALFEGGQSAGFQFIIGEGQMLPAFDKAVRGMKAGESKTFPLEFPQDYQSSELAGKEADFIVTMKKLESQNLPEINDAFAKQLGVTDGTLEALRTEVKINLERAVKQRLMGLNKTRVMEALLAAVEFEVPKALVNDEVERMRLAAVEDFKRRGFKDSDVGFIQPELFKDGAEKRTRTGLLVLDLVRKNNLQPKPEQLKAQIEEIALNYEDPTEVIAAYLGDRERMAEVESLTIERNVVEFILTKAQVTEKEMVFDELMTAN
jgi:trigger factor